MESSLDTMLTINHSFHSLLIDLRLHMAEGFIMFCHSFNILIGTLEKTEYHGNKNGRHGDSYPPSNFPYRMVELELDVRLM